MASTLKTIIYRGGIVKFEIPVHWKEEYDPQGGGTFYEDRPDSGTLRLNVLSFSKKDGSASGSVSQSVEITKEMKEATENGTPLHLYRWIAKYFISPIEMRVVIFTHTILARQEGDPRMKEELDLIDKSVREARFSIAPGVTGNYDHRAEER